jgi:hypothetical protein
MTLCPVALAVGCEKCIAFSVCPLKGVIGDYKEPGKTEPEQRASETKRDEKWWGSLPPPPAVIDPLPGPSRAGPISLPRAPSA